MNHLHRELAPISDAGWDAIDDEAKVTWPHSGILHHRDRQTANQTFGAPVEFGLAAEL